ncbi:MAG: amidohydrolase family protein [Planctomycetota bacterium]|nr:amidohydrolase family protein [Planctomycetota bacterium]
MPHRMNRRVFVTSTAGAIAGGRLLHQGNKCVAEPSKARMPIVDSHLHCFAGSKDVRFPYHERAPYRPETAATPEHLLKCMDGAGVDFAVVVHPEPYQDDHRYLQHCLKAGGGRFKGTSLVFADRPGSVEKLPGLKKSLGDLLVTTRIHAYAPERLPPFGTPEIRKLWTTAADLGLAMQLHFEPRYAPGFEPYIREFSKMTVVIDHMGRPFQGTPKEHAVVLKWARFPNTIMKIASLPQQDKYPHRKIQPVIRQLTDAFGAKRMIYGGGFNAEATPDSYRADRERVRSLLAHLSASDQAMVLGGTAARVYGFSKAAK